MKQKKKKKKKNICHVFFLQFIVSHLFDIQLNKNKKFQIAYLKISKAPHLTNHHFLV